MNNSVGSPYTERFAKGRGMPDAPETKSGGGDNLKKPMTVLSDSEGDGMNRRRNGMRGASEKHYNGKTTLPSTISNTRP